MLKPTLITLALFSLLLACQPVGLNNAEYPDTFGDDTRLSLEDSSIEISSNSVASGTTANITVTAKDELGNKYTQEDLTVACSLAGGSSDGSFSTPVNNGDGTYSLTMTATTSGTAANLACTLDSSSISSSLPSVTVTFTPYEISNLALWLDASSLNLNNNDPVSSWTDLSGNSNHATQGTSNDQPTYQTGVLNSLPAINFDGASDHLAFASLSMQPATVFIVGRYNLPQFNAPYLGDDTNNEFVGYSGASVFYFSTIASLTVADPVPSSFQLYTAIAEASGTNSSIEINGASVVTGDRNWGASALQYVGRRAADRFKGDIAEIVIYSTALGSSDITSVTTYLQSKYGL